MDCVLLSSFSEDPVLGVPARGHAAAHTYWVSVSVPAQCSVAMPSGVTGPHGFGWTAARPLARLPWPAWISTGQTRALTSR